MKNAFAVEVVGRFSGASMSFVRELVVRGAGVGILDERIAAADECAHRLVRVLPEWRLPRVDLHLLTASRLVPARVTLFGELLADRLMRE